MQNICSKNLIQVDKSVIKVFDSYGRRRRRKNFILVQEYIENADNVGVIFTANINNGANFRTVNFNESNSTDLITSGNSNGQIIYYYKKY